MQPGAAMRFFIGLLAPGVAITLAGCVHSGQPFHDAVYHGGPQKIPGRVQCAYYDLGGEGVAYHTEDTKNKGSGGLNKPDGTYLNEFRIAEAVSISYTKFDHPTKIDDNPFNLVIPPKNQFYVGWTTAGEWFNITVNVEEADEYAIDLLYTSHQGGAISLEWNGRPLSGPIAIQSTFNAAEPIKWRNWHHWNVMKSIAVARLPKGVGVLKVRVLSEGNMNLACLDFRPSANAAHERVP
jgi:hypothetical protein